MGEPAPVHYPQMREREGLIAWGKQRAHKAPLFAALHLAIADDEELLNLALEAADGQPCGRMLLAAVHYLLLKDSADPLAAYFPSIAGNPLPADGAPALLKPFCLAHRDPILEILRTQTLQTTDPDRSVQLLFALDEIAKSVGTPFSIVEVGCSAGLLLLFDHYRYDFGGGVTFGPADGPMTISSFRFAGDPPPLPRNFPSIGRRVGLDLNPVDVSNPDERDWILACVVSDFVDKFRKLRRALDYRATVPIETVTGDAMLTLPQTLASIAGPVCVFHSRCLYQWSIDAQDAFAAILKQLSQSRTIHRLSIEGGLAKAGESSSIVGINHTIYDGGEGVTRLLGEVRNKIEIAWLI